MLTPLIIGRYYDIYRNQMNSIHINLYLRRL